jgi:hypothetical protein
MRAYSHAARRRAFGAQRTPRCNARRCAATQRATLRVHVALQHNTAQHVATQRATREQRGVPLLQHSAPRCSACGSRTHARCSRSPRACPRSPRSSACQAPSASTASCAHANSSAATGASNGREKRYDQPITKNAACVSCNAHNGAQTPGKTQAGSVHAVGSMPQRGVAYVALDGSSSAAAGSFGGVSARKRRSRPYTMPMCGPKNLYLCAPRAGSLTAL